MENNFYELGIKYLEENDIDTTLIPEEYIINVGKSIVANSEIEEEYEAEIIKIDEEELIVTNSDGEILAFLDAPSHDTIDREKLLEWVGEKMTAAKARQAGHEAEKQVWIDTINDRFDWKIRQEKQKVSGLTYMYTPFAQQYMDDIRKKSKKIIKTLTVGLLKLTYRAVSASIDVVDEAKAIEWCEKVELFDAIKKSLLKTPIKNSEHIEVIKKDPVETGLFYNPGGEEKFEIK